MPVVHPYVPGAKGNSHGNDYYIENPEIACVDSAKWQLGMLKLLLENDGARAYKIIEEHKPLFNSKEEYLAYCDSLSCSGNRINYVDGKAEILL